MPTAHTTGCVVCVTDPRSFAMANTLKGLDFHSKEVYARTRQNISYLLMMPGPELTALVNEPLLLNRPRQLASVSAM